MKDVEEGDLKAGDVLLYISSGLLSRTIQRFDGTPYSHAAIYLGQGTVGEVLAWGLERKSLADSRRGQEVHGRRHHASDLVPVLTRAHAYLDDGNRYAYEQLLLLAILGLTRRIPRSGLFKLLMRRVLDAAALVLTRYVGAYVSAATADSREPMICSEFVYRCFDEALPGDDDLYGISIDATRSTPRGIEADSLLDEMAGLFGKRSTQVPGGRVDAVKRVGPATEIEVERAMDDVGDALHAYLEADVRGDGSAAFPEGQVDFTVPSDPELWASVERFAAEAERARLTAPVPPDRGATRGVDPLLLAQIPYGLRHLFRTAADFVTPGDLAKTDSLASLG